MAKTQDWAPHLLDTLYGKRIVACNPDTQTLATSSGDVVQFNLLAIFESNWHRLREFGVNLKGQGELFVTDVRVRQVPQVLTSLPGFHYLALDLIGSMGDSRCAIELTKSEGPYLMEDLDPLPWPHRVTVTPGASILEKALIDLEWG